VRTDPPPKPLGEEATEAAPAAGGKKDAKAAEAAAAAAAAAAVAEGAEPPAPPPQPTRRELGKALLQLGDLLDGEVSSPHGSFHRRRKLARDDAALVLQPPPGSLQGEYRAGERAHTCQPSCPHPAGAPPAPLSVGAAALAH
jgi:hypothetical protein